MAYEYMTYPGNGELVASIFDAVARVSGTSGIGGAIQLASLIGFIIVLCVGVFKLDLKEGFNSIIGIAIVWMVFMTPKVTVLVTESSGHGFSGRQQAVANVPFGMAVPASIVSEFGVWFTKKMENNFRTPDDLNYSETGILFGSRLYREIYSTKIVDETLKQDWALFMHQCSFFDMHLYKKYTLNDLRASNDLVALLGRTNQSLFTNISDEASRNNGVIQYQPGKASYTCIDAYTKLANRTNFHVQSGLVSTISHKIFSSMGFQSVGLDVQSAFVNLGNSTFQYLLNDSRASMLKNIEQASMMNMVREAGIRNGQRMGNGALVASSFAQAQAEQQWVTSQMNGVGMASMALPQLRSTAEAILLGLFPIVIVIALLGGIMAFKSFMFYFMALFWLQLWAPIASIMNYIFTIHSKTELMAQAAVGGTSIMTMTNAEGMLKAAVNAQATAGSAFWLIPVLAGGIVFGGRSLANVFGGMGNAAQAASNAAGSGVGAGNINAGNMAYNNANMNKHSSDSVYTSQNMMTATSAGGTSWAGLGSGANRVQGRADSYGNVSGQSTISASSVSTRQAERSETAGHQAAAIATSSLAAAQGSSVAWAVQQAQTTGSSSGYGLNLSASNSEALNRTHQAAERLSNQYSGSTTSSISSAIAAAGNVAPENRASAAKSSLQEGGFGGVSGGWRGTAQNLESLSAAVANEATAMKQEGISFSEDFVNQVTNSQSFNDSLSSGNSLAQTTSSNLTRSNTATMQAQEHFATAQSYRESAAEQANSGAMVTINNATALKESGVSVNEAHADPMGAAGILMSAGLSAKQGLEQTGSGTAYNPGMSISSSDRPTNGVSSAHASNLSNVRSVGHSNMESVYGSAEASGLNSDQLPNDIQTQGATLKGGYESGKAEVQGNVEAASGRINSNVDQVANQSQRVVNELDSGFMGLNTHKLPFTNQEKVDENLRNQKGYIGSGSDQAGAFVGRNANLGQEMKITEQPGNNSSTGGRTYGPKE